MTEPSLADFLLERLAATASAWAEQHPEDEQRRAFVLADCEAKRRIVKLHKARGVQGQHAWTCVVCDHAPVRWEAYLTYPCPTLRLLALPYADHPDYRQEWRP